LAGYPLGTQLLLVGVQLTEVPDWVRNLTALTELNMGENQLTVDGRG
jgi:Leucine-rich repeat (LRR) protein